MHKAKILVVGPCESGKTCLSNYLAEATESSGGQYHPTQGVRILEFEVEGESPATGQLICVEVELWDCSGSKRFERCWPAFSRDAHGVVLVHNPGPAQQERELVRWYSYFVSRQGLKDDQCVIFTHHKPSTDGSTQPIEPQPLTSQKLSGVRQVHTSLADDPGAVRDEFCTFLLTLITGRKDRQDQEERMIVDADTEH